MALGPGRRDHRRRRDAATIGWPGAATALTANADGGTYQGYVGLVSVMITYLLPLLIANTGGRIVYGARGGGRGAVWA